MEIEALPLDTCFVLREGSDITLVTWGALVKETLAAANDHRMNHKDQFVKQVVFQ